MHGLAQRVIFHEDDARQPIAMAREVSEGNVPDGERDQPVGEARRALEPHRLPGRERAGELRCARRLDAPHARRAVRRRQPDHDSRDQPASADRHHDRLDLGQLRGDLEPHGRPHGDTAQPLSRLADVLGGDHAYARFFFLLGLFLLGLFLLGLRRAAFGAAALGAGVSASASPPSPFSASSSFTTRATSTTRSPGVRFMTLTPWVLRPEIRIPSTGTRIMIPFLVIIMSSSSGSTSLSATMSPVLSDRLRVMIPRPPRCCTRYSSSSERLPMPFSVTVRSVDFRRTTTMSITWSFLSSSIPFTPVAVRPMSRTSFSWKRMLIPWRVASTMSLRPSVTCTSISSSPFSMLMARIPTERGLPNSESRVFFTTPCFVANSRYWSSENSRTGTRDARRSFGFMATHERIGLPRAARAACGISCTLSQ